MNGRYQGKRFFAFILITICIMGAFYLHHPETFGSLANALTGMFAAYVAGQSATDWKEASKTQ